MDDQLQTREYRCPLCESLLNREKWTKITGQWEESKKQLEDQKKLAEKYQKDKIELEKRAAIDKKRAAREAEARGIVKGIQKEKGQTIRMTKMIKKQAGDLDNAHKH